jgi:chaperonin cofactor prefoldin
MAEGEEAIVELNRVVKDTQMLQKRFQKLKGQIDSRLAGGKGVVVVRSGDYSFMF